MKILFMGTPDIASGCLQELIDKKYDIIGVVTQPDKQVGRGKKIVFSPVKQVAIENNLPVYQPIKAKEESFVNEIKELNPDVIVVVAYGQILSKEFLEIPKQGCINVHVSLLPKYRGAAPINWVIINGEEKTGVSTMYMDKKMKVWKTKVLNEKSSKEPGTILKVDQEGIKVATKDNVILISEIQMPNKKRMEVKEFIKGNTLEVGSVLQ